MRESYSDGVAWCPSALRFLRSWSVAPRGWRQVSVTHSQLNLVDKGWSAGDGRAELAGAARAAQELPRSGFDWRDCK